MQGSYSSVKLSGWLKNLQKQLKATAGGHNQLNLLSSSQKKKDGTRGWPIAGHWRAICIRFRNVTCFRHQSDQVHAPFWQKNPKNVQRCITPCLSLRSKLKRGGYSGVPRVKTNRVNAIRELRAVNSACPATLKAAYCPLQMRGLCSLESQLRLVTDGSVLIRGTHRNKIVLTNPLRNQVLNN